MYQRIDHGDGRIEIREHFKSPMVYLDHWALNEISLDKSLRERFLNIMNAKGGTFRLSMFNIVELSKQDDASQIDSILDMISSIPDCGFINSDPRVVIAKENALIANPEVIFEVKNPSAEIGIVATHLVSHNYPIKFHPADILRNLIPELPTKAMLSSNSQFVKDMQGLLKTGRGDRIHLQRAEQRFRNFKKAGPKYQRPTREVYTMALDFVMRNTQMRMAEYSEWTDLFHVVVPVSYCDIVMVDKRWKSFVAQTGLSYPQIAMVFDKRSSNDFFAAIESWQSTEPAVSLDGFATQ